MASGSDSDYASLMEETLIEEASPMEKDSNNDESLSTSEDQPYNTQPGRCVIINNMVFKKASELTNGKKDEQDLAALFITLGFNVKIHENLTANEMIRKVEAYGKKQYNGAFFLIILSHGGLVDNKEAVLGTDCKPVAINWLQTFFSASNCPSLDGVPKIFLVHVHVDACQGSQPVLTEPADSMVTHFMIIQCHVHASSQENMASRESDHDQGGTCTCAFSQTFVEVIKNADPSTPFATMIQEIREKVQESNSDHTVNFVDTLSHDYFIKREESMPRIDELCNKLYAALKQWITIRENTIQKIHNTIKNLRFHHRNVNVTRIAGSSVSILGSAMALASIVMAPATAGLSLVLPVGSVALALAGGGTSAGALVVDILIQQSNVQQAQEQLIRDYEQLHIISALAIAIQSKINDEHAMQQCQSVSTAKLLVELGLALIQGVFRTDSLGVRIAEVFAIAFTAVKAGGIAPAVAVNTAIVKVVGKTLGSSAAGAIASTFGEALSGGLGGALGKGLIDIIAPKASGIAGARAGSAAVKVLAKAGAVLNVLTIPIDLVEIIRSGTNLANGSETEAIKQLTNKVKHLKNEKEAIQIALEKRQTQILSHSKFFEEAKVQAKIPFLHHQLLECDFSGKELHIEDHDITLTIPEGAVTKGKRLYLEVGVAMYGPFIFPTRDAQPISPILWLCPLDGDFAVNKPIQIKLPHFLTGLSTERLQDHGVGFMKANHTDKIIDRHGQIYYKFQNSEGSKKFISNDIESKSFGILTTKHCCFYCIEAKKSPIMTLDATYYLIRIENSSHPNYEVHFAAICYLKTCLEAVKEQYPANDGYVIRPPKSFKFEENKTEPYTVIHLKITIQDEQNCIIGMEPIPPEIHATDINFWERKFDMEEMHLQHNNRMYPPRVTITVTMTRNDPVALPIKFGGSLMRNHRLDLKLTFPLVHMELAKPVKLGMAQLGDHLSVADLRKVQDSIWEARTDWYNLGLGLDIAPDSLDAIQQENAQKPDHCFRAMLTKWLKQDSPRPTWSALAEALRSPSVDHSKLAEQILRSMSS